MDTSLLHAAVTTTTTTAAADGSSTFGQIVSFVIAILSIVAMWRIFAKAGEAGWKSLIPFYNVYVYYKICWKGWIGIVALLLDVFGAISLVGSLVAALAAAGISVDATQTQALSTAVGVFSGMFIFGIVCGIAGLVITIIHYVKLAKAFGQGGGFAVGLVLLNTIFILILGFGGFEYQGNPSEK